MLGVAPSGYYAWLDHSDRGVHYAYADYLARLDGNRIRPSMSRKGHCWDNAVAESFFSSLAFEREFDARWYDVHDVERDPIEHIDSFPNSQWKHPHNQYLSPLDLERQFCQEGTAA